MVNLGGFAWSNFSSSCPIANLTLDEMCGTVNGKLICGERQDSQGSVTTSLATPSASSGVESTPASTFTTSMATKSTSPVTRDQTSSVVQTSSSDPIVDDSQTYTSAATSTVPSTTASPDTTNACGSVQKRNIQNMRIMGHWGATMKVLRILMIAWSEGLGSHVHVRSL